jgi:kelch-like protein 26
MEMAIILIGGFKSTGVTNEITYCFPTEDSLTDWRHLTTIPHMKQSNFGMAVLNNRIYCVGGSYDVSCRNFIHPLGFKFCPVSNKWTEISPMNQDRSCFSLTVMNNCLYAVGGNSEFEEGGFKANRFYSTVEKYNPETDLWEYIAKIPEYKTQHAGASYKSHLYISGGLDAPGNILSTFNCYNSVCDYWASLSKMPIGTYYICVSYLQNGLKPFS